MPKINDLADLVTLAEESVPEEWGEFTIRVNVPGYGLMAAREVSFDPDETGTLTLWVEEV